MLKNSLGEKIGLIFVIVLGYSSLLFYQSTIDIPLPKCFFKNIIGFSCPGCGMGRALIISIFLGAYGIDRFYIGDTGLGVGKLLTCGGVGIWAIVDWFGIQKATRQKNFEKIQQFLF